MINGVRARALTPFDGMWSGKRVSNSSLNPGGVALCRLSYSRVEGQCTGSGARLPSSTWRVFLVAARLGTPDYDELVAHRLHARYARADIAREAPLVEAARAAPERHVAIGDEDVDRRCIDLARVLERAPHPHGELVVWVRQRRLYRDRLGFRCGRGGGRRAGVVGPSL